MAGIDNNTLLYLRGDSFNDLSLSPKTITNNGLTVLDNGDFSKSLDFTSTKNATVTLPTFLGEPFTVEWYEYNTKKGASGQYCSVFTNVIKPATTSSNNNYGFGIGTNALTSGEPSISLSTNMTSPWDICQDKLIGNCVLNKWVHRCIVYNGTSVISYENGKKYMEFNLGGKKILNTYNTFQFNRWREFNYSSFRYIRSFRVSNIARYTGDFTPHSCTYAYNSININVTNKDFAKADFNISKLGQETINKVEIYQNEEVKETYIDSYDNLTFNHGGKNFKIVVTYDDNYTEEQEIHIGNSKAKIYLYKEGNECESITGGITDADMLDSTGNHWKVNGTLTKNENSIHIQTGSTTTSVKFAKTKNLIDLTKFKDLYINVLNTTEYSPDKFTCLLVSKTLDIGNSASGFTRNVNTKGLNKLDISDKTESYYVATRVLNNSSVLEFDYIYLETNENVISINSQNTSSINFSCNNLDNLITITKAEVYINDKLSKSYNDNFDSITYNIDNSLCSIGYNKIVVKVTYSQGDDIYETLEEVLTHTNTVNNLSTSSSLKELIDRQELLTNSIEVQKNNLKSILESKNIEVSEGENKLSILIDKVNELDEYIPRTVYLYKEGDECTYLTGGWNTSLSGSEGTIEKKSNYIRCYVGSNVKCQAYASFENSIDCSKYSKLKIQINSITRAYHSTPIYDTMTDIRVNITDEIKTVIRGNSALGISTIEVDITNLKTITRVLAFLCRRDYANSGVGEVHLLNVWMER